MTHELKISDKVRFAEAEENRIAHLSFGRYYPAPGTIGIVKGINTAGGYTDLLIQWPEGSTSGDDCWRCSAECLEIVKDDSPIKDSGDRTQFSTGAVRDMHTGKGRMDLLPWRAIMAVSKHCENGALKYGEHNVDKGIPLHSFMDSGMRHAAKVMIGETDEDHLVAAAWNMLWAIEMRFTHPELCDIPWRADEEKED